jgi:spore maturation protein SpmB
VYYGASLIVSTATLLLSAVPAAISERLGLSLERAMMVWFGTALLLGGGIAFLSTLSVAAIASLSSTLGNAVLFGLVLLFVVLGALRGVAVFEAFVEGAREGFEVAKNLLPYLVAMLCAVGILRASGALDSLLTGIRYLTEWMTWDTRFVDALPVALVKPFSGSAARAMMIETMSAHGVDSFPALLAATMQGSTETTFYVLAVYFGAVGIQRARYAVACALLADFAGVVASIAVCYWFFG